MWRDAWEDLLCQTQLSATWRISVQRGVWGPRKSHLGVCGCWMPEPGSGPVSAGQSPCSLRGSALPQVRQTALPCPSGGPWEPTSPHLDWLIRLWSACAGSEATPGPCTAGKRSSEGNKQGRPLFRTAPQKRGDMRSRPEGRKEAGQVLGPQEGVALGPAGGGGGHLLACTLGK